MIYITYCTKEMMEIDYKLSRRKYEITNDFLGKISFNADYSVVNTDVSTIVSKISSDTEQIYYEKVVWDYNNDIKPSEILNKWDELFKEIDRRINNKCNELIKNISDDVKSVANNIKIKKDLNKLSNKVIVVNMSQNLGPWQSIEILISIKHGAQVYWIGVDDFISIINDITSEEKSDVIKQTELFKARLFKKAIKIVQ